MKIGNLTMALDAIGALVFLTVAIIGLLIALATRMQRRGRMVFRLTPVILALALGQMAIENFFVAALALQLLGLTSVFLLLGRNPTLPPLQAHRTAAAALKYIAVVTLSTAFLLVGFALASAYQFDPQRPALARVVAAAVAVGFGLRLAAVPLHLWFPDVCETGPPMATAVLVSVTDVAALALLIRVLNAYPWLFASPATTQTLLVGAVATSVVGGVFALGTSDLRRLVAYAAIEETGVIAAALLSRNAVGVVAAVLLAINLAITKFVLCVGLLNIEETAASRLLRQLRGLARRMPLSAAALALAAVSAAGLPPSLGFVGRYLALQAVAGVDLRLAVGLLIGTLLSVAYYGKSIYGLFFASLERPGPGVRESRSLALLSLCGAVAVVLLGLIPGPLISFLLESSRGLTFVQG